MPWPSGRAATGGRAAVGGVARQSIPGGPSRRRARDRGAYPRARVGTIVSLERRSWHEIHDVGESEQELGGRQAAGRGGGRRGDEVQGGAQAGRRAGRRGGAPP